MGFDGLPHLVVGEISGDDQHGRVGKQRLSDTGNASVSDENLAVFQHFRLIGVGVQMDILRKIRLGQHLLAAEVAAPADVDGLPAGGQCLDGLLQQERAVALAHGAPGHVQPRALGLGVQLQMEPQHLVGGRQPLRFVLEQRGQVAKGTVRRTLVPPCPFALEAQDLVEADAVRVGRPQDFLIVLLEPPAPPQLRHKGGGVQLELEAVDLLPQLGQESGLCVIEEHVRRKLRHRRSQRFHHHAVHGQVLDLHEGVDAGVRHVGEVLPCRPLPVGLGAGHVAAILPDGRGVIPHLDVSTRETFLVLGITVDHHLRTPLGEEAEQLQIGVKVPAIGHEHTQDLLHWPNTSSTSSMGMCSTMPLPGDGSSQYPSGTGTPGSGSMTPPR